MQKNQLNSSKHSGYSITKFMKKLTTMTAPIVLELNLGQKKAYTLSADKKQKNTSF